MQIYSYDLLIQEIVDEIPFSTWRFNETLNKPGGFACAIAANHPKADPDLLHVGRHAIFFDDNGSLRFGGILWSAKVSSDQETLTVGGEGFWSYFREGRRNLRASYNHTLDQFTHVVDLIAIAQGEAGGDLGITVRYPSLSGITRTLEILATERKAFAEIVEDMADAEDGFDFAITAEWSGNQPALFLDLFHPERGVAKDNAWELGTHVSLKKEWEEETGANRVDAIGATVDGVPLVAPASVPPTETLRLDRVVQYTDVTDPDTLLALAKGERKRALKPQGNVTVKVENHDEAGLDTFTVGDSIFLVGDLGYRQLDQRMRIVGYDASADEDETGVPTVTVDLEPA